VCDLVLFRLVREFPHVGFHLRLCFGPHPPDSQGAHVLVQLPHVILCLAPVALKVIQLGLRGAEKGWGGEEMRSGCGLEVSVMMVIQLGLKGTEKL
jgi:hypothetical protein